MLQYENATYRSSDGSFYVDFLFWNLGTDGANDGRRGWRVYIISPIDFKGKSSSYVETHRLHDPNETYPYICWTNELKTLKQAKAVAALWADCIALYIKGEGRFNDIASRLRK